MAELVVALDFPDADSALALARQLRGVAPWCKVGMELFCLAGPAVLTQLREMGFHVFLDLKFYDIPNTVAQAVRAAAQSGAELLTIHTQGGERMCREAVAAAAACKRPPLVFGVTVLTSFGPGQMPGITQAPADFAGELAGMADSWQLDGIVCSGQEAAAVKARHPRLRCLCPGIRPAAASADDQCRIMTPAAAVAAGADYLVVGRPITRAADPLAAAHAILDEMHTC